MPGQPVKVPVFGVDFLDLARRLSHGEFVPSIESISARGLIGEREES